MDPSVNLEQIEPINPKRLVVFINHWIHSTISCLNDFSANCESRLLQLEQKLALASDALSILEAKLSSIPGLDDLTIEKSNTPTESVNPNVIATDECKAEAEVQTTTPVKESDTIAEKQDKEPKESVCLNPVSKDPAYSTFFKMVSVGVPPQAVKIKMAASGLDPSLLDTPNAPCPKQTSVDETDTFDKDLPDGSSGDSDSPWSD